MVQHHIILKAARFTGADFSSAVFLFFSTFICSSLFGPVSPIIHSPLRFSLAVLTPSQSSLYQFLLPPAAQLHISVSSHHFVLFFQLPTSRPSKWKCFLIICWVFKIHLVLLVLVSPPLFVHQLPPAEPTINQHRNIQLTTRLFWNVPFLFSPLTHSISGPVTPVGCGGQCWI